MTRHQSKCVVEFCNTTLRHCPGCGSYCPVHDGPHDTELATDAAHECYLRGHHSWRLYRTQTWLYDKRWAVKGDEMVCSDCGAKQRHTILCMACGAKDSSLFVTGCGDCGEERVEVAKRRGVSPHTLVPGADFIPNRLCRDCCISGHHTRPSWEGE